MEIRASKGYLEWENSYGTMDSYTLGLLPDFVKTMSQRCPGSTEVIEAAKAYISQYYKIWSYPDASWCPELKRWFTEELDVDTFVEVCLHRRKNMIK